MEEKKIISTKGCGCECGHKKYLCWAIGFVVLVIVFCAGVKLGEMRAYLSSFYGQDYYGYQAGGMMRWNNQNNNYGYGMMRGWRNYYNALPEDQTATDTTTTTKQ